MSLKQQWMYKCEACECIKLLSIDNGDRCIRMCEPCNLLRFFEKVYVANTDSLYYEMSFYIKSFSFKDVERREEDGKRKG